MRRISRFLSSLTVVLLIAFAAYGHAHLADAAQPEMTAVPPGRFVLAPVETGSVEIAADAEIVAPAAGVIPAADAEPRLLTPAECQNLAQILFAGQQMYSGGRAEKEARSAALTEKLRGDPAHPQWLCQLEEVRTELASLPESPVEFAEAATWSSPEAWTADVVSDGSDGLFRRLQCGADGTAGASYMLYTASDNGEPRIGSVWSTTSGAARRQAQSFGLTGGELPPPETLPEPRLTQDEAARTAGALALAFGLADYSLQSADLVYGRINGRVQKGWLLNYTRTVGGVPAALSAQDHGGFRSQTPRSGQISGGDAEVLEFLVCDAGPVRVTWECPYMVSEVSAANAQLLPFAAVERIFAETAPVLCASADAVGSVKERIAVTRVELHLQYLPDEKRLTPVWCFYGSRFLLRGNEIEDISGTSDRPLLVLDAVNGAPLT